ncbi:MAG: MFS transporter [Spirochaetes bacterium]|nr:MAG: MFS transporter [Spirochaetota bacterium]
MIYYKNSIKPGGGISAHAALAVCTLLFTVNFMDRSVMSAVLEPMKRDLGLSDAQAGLVQTLFFISLAFLSTPVAYLVDRWSRKKSIGLMALAWSLFTYGTGVARSFTALLAMRIFVATGEAGFSSGSIALITASYPERMRARVVALFNMGLPLGSALGVMLGGYISAHHGGWRAPFYLFAFPGVALGLAAFFLKDYATAPENTGAGRPGGFIKSARELFSIPSLRWNYFGYAMMNAFVTMIFAWLPSLIIRISGIGEDKAGLLMAMVLGGCLLGTMSGGVVADLWQRRNPQARMLLPAAAALLSLAIMMLALYLFNLGMTGVTLALLVAVGFVCTLGIPAQQAVTQDVVPTRLKGLSFGMLMFMMYFGGGWSPLLVGAISDGSGSGVGGLMTGFISITVVTLLLSSWCYFRGSRFYPGDAAKFRE